MTSLLPNTTLSTNDTRILNALFDPETLPSSVAQQKDTSSSVDPSLPAHPSIPTPQLTSLERQQCELIGRISNTSSPTELNAAIDELNSVIQQWPEYAGARVNRAMLRRIQLEADLKQGENIFTSSSDPSESTIDLIFSNLSTAIHLSLPSSSSSSHTTPVSPHAAKVLRTAYSHRAYLHLKAVETEARLRGLTRSELEELASRDFAAAARFGDGVAREMSVRTNPYKKMCGVIVRDALREERGGDGWR